MPTQGNNIGIYVNLTGGDYDAYTAAVAAADDSDDTTSVLDYSFDNLVANGRGTEGEGNWVLIACATTATINLSNSTSETACKGDTAGALTGNSVRNVTSGNQTWNMSVDGLIELFDFPAEGGDNPEATWDDDENVGTPNVDLYSADQKARAGFVNLMRAALNRTQLLVAFSTGEQLDSEGVATNNVEYVGKAFINSIDATAAVGDYASYSCTFEGNGALNKRTTDTDASA